MPTPPTTDTAPVPPADPDGFWWPWRSAAAGWVTAAAFLVVGLPLFLRMPLWCDVTLYDVAARTILAGGVHYRDVFDTNLPGFVWILSGVRRLFGTSIEAVRAVDLAFVAGTTVLLLRWAGRGGATAAGRAWAAAAVACFYPFLTEFNHAQRDVWMTLPVVAASLLRLRRVRAAGDAACSDWAIARGALLEGAVWGLAFWIKPHIIIPAACAWFASGARLAGTSPTGHLNRRLWVDLGGTVAGGAAVGAVGILWLVGTGTWPYLIEVFTRWNTAYLDAVLVQITHRLPLQFTYFTPWSPFVMAAVPLAVLNLVDARVWSALPTPAAGPVARRLPAWLYDRPADDGARFARALLAAVFVGWVASALLLQKDFHYAHVPEVILSLAVFAANRWAVPFLGIVLHALLTLWLLAADASPALRQLHERWQHASPTYYLLAEPHTAADAARTGWWLKCFAAGDPRALRELRNGVGMQYNFHAGVDWVQLGTCEDYLREQGVGDGEVIGWHDTPHALYLTLDVRQAIRFMHVSTALTLGDWQYEQVRADTRRAVDGGARYVVSDLYRLRHYSRGGFTDLNPDTELPWNFPDKQLDQFPFDQPIVFRSPSGRYLVHRIASQVRECRIPDGIEDD